MVFKTELKNSIIPSKCLKNVRKIFSLVNLRLSDVRRHRLQDQLELLDPSAHRQPREEEGLVQGDGRDARLDNAHRAHHPVETSAFLVGFSGQRRFRQLDRLHPHRHQRLLVVVSRNLFRNSDDVIILTVRNL